jgi:hypothetical protein
MNKHIFYNLIPFIICVFLIGINILLIKDYQNLDKTIPPIPEHITYQTAIREQLPSLIKEKAEEFGCRGFIIPLEAIDADAPTGMREDINLALSAYPDWRVLVTQNEKDQMMNRWESTMNIWGSLLSGREIERFLQTQSRTALQTNYSLRAEYNEGNYAHEATRRIILTVNDERTHTRLFEVAVLYTDPATIQRWESEKQMQRDIIAKKAGRSEKAYVAIKGIAIITVGFYIGLMMIFIIKKGRGSRIKSAYLKQIEKRQDLIDNGHYRAAYNLAAKYLEYFPEDVEIRAFRDRLLIFTNGDPERAEEAYMETLKLKHYVEAKEVQNDINIDPSELERCVALIPYNPKLKELYNRVIGLQKDRIAYEKSAIDEKMSAFWTALRLKDVQAALMLYEKIRQTASGHDGLTQIESVLKKRSGNFVLSNESKVIDLFTKETILIGRKDESVNPDVPIDTNRVSRKHASIKRDGKVYEIIDHDSANGTYLNGEQIKKEKLSNGDTINFGKIIDLRVCIEKEDTEPICMIDGTAMSIVLFKKEAEVESDSTRYPILFDEGITLCGSGESTVLIPGEQASIGDMVFDIEEV